MTRRAVYTIRDCNNCVRYVGSSHWPQVRFAGHAAAKTDIGKFLRHEHAEGRDVSVVIEEWFHSDEEGFAAEKLYIQGYSKLLGKTLLNVVRHVINESDGSHCLHCEKSPKKRGLCGFHFNMYDAQLHRIPAKGRKRFEDKCILLGLILEEEIQEDSSTAFETVCEEVLVECDLPGFVTYGEYRNSAKDRVETQKPKRLGRLSNPVSIEIELDARAKRQALLKRS